MQRLRNEFPDPETRRREQRGDGDKVTWGFMRWELSCEEGWGGWIGVGGREIRVWEEVVVDGLDESGRERRKKKWEKGVLAEVKEDAVRIHSSFMELRLSDL